jgi:signal transduction histidine kinase
MLLAISWILVVRFVKSMQANESFNIELQLRIQEARSELNQEHQRVQVLLQQEAKLGERNRIMKDLHDGLGSYLMSAHSIARIKQLDDGIQQALNDALFWLKTSIDTLDSEDGDLASLLGTFRYRIEPQLKSCGIILDWKMDDISKYQLPSEQHLHVVRIMQEAVTNVIKHAKASCLSIHVKSLEDQHVCLSIEDNGCGISGEQVGHGLKNMRERIEMIGGSMHMDEAVSGGVLLEFTLPA